MYHVVESTVVHSDLDLSFKNSLRVYFGELTADIFEGKGKSSEEVVKGVWARKRSGLQKVFDNTVDRNGCIEEYFKCGKGRIY